MASKNSNSNILVGVDLQKNEVQKTLDELIKGLDKKVPLDVSVPNGKQVASTMDEISSATKKASDSGNDLNLTFNVANELFQKSTQIITDMVGQVYELDTALTEFKKVSDLSGDSLNDYVDQLSVMGGEVARTGKPDRSEPVCTDGKCA